MCVTTVPGGLCTVDCSTTACPDGLVCLPVGGQSVCVKSCTTRDNCRPDWQCQSGSCVPPCTVATDCGEHGFTCDNGQCTPLPGAADGEPCGVDDDCSSQLCLLGTCRRSCDDESDCASTDTCALNRVGANGPKPTSRIRPACVPRRGGKAPGQDCAVDDDCNQGGCVYDRCALLCSGDATCGSGSACGSMPILVDIGDFPTAGMCLPSPGLIVLDGAEQIVPVASTVRSFAIYTAAQTTNYTIYAGVDSLTDPMGVDVYTTPQTEAAFYDLLVRYLPTEISSTMLVPNSPNYSLVTGVYSFIAGPSASAKSSTTIYLKLAKEPLTTGKLSLNFYVTDLTDAACPNAQVTVQNGPTKLAQVIQQLRDIYGKANITITDVTFHDASGVPNSIASDAPSELGTILQMATANQTATIGMDIVLIRSINESNDPSLVTLGIAGGIPSAPVLGDPHSGAVVAMDIACDYGSDWAFEIASTMAHEAGHTFGLFHNVEQDKHTDPIPDNDTNNPKTAASNLMFWEEFGGSTLSAQQGAVIRSDPKVRQ